MYIQIGDLDFQVTD